ncbi:MAG: hypothetical protein AB7T49_19280 [Oligoflexales bacterium]
MVRRNVSFVTLIFALGVSACGIDSKNKKAPKPDPTSPEASKTEPEVSDTDLRENEILSKNKKFATSLEWVSEPKAESYVSARLTFILPDRKIPETVSNIVFDPQMSSMGHGTSTADQTIRQSESATNVFIVDHIYFIMGGSWEIRLTAKVNGSSDTVTIPVEVR